MLKKAMYLKIKLGELGAEGSLNRHETIRQQRRYSKWMARAKAGRIKFATELERVARQLEMKPDGNVWMHRKTVVRPEARATNLAYGLLKGRSYDEVENFAWTQPAWDKIERMAVEYSDEPKDVAKAKFDQWKAEALRGVEEDASGDKLHHKPMEINSWTLTRLRSNSKFANLGPAGS